MIERTFVAQKTREYYIRKYVEKNLGNVGISTITLKKIPLGEKIIIHTSRPSLIVGSKGANIRSLTKKLKDNFNLENPQIEISEVANIFLNANIVAERIVSSLERFGAARFKGIGHKMMENVMNAGALGIEITISGKIPGARAKSWRFYTGYLKKCGDVALSVRTAKKSALLKSGIIGVKVAIMPPDIILPDKITLLQEPIQSVIPSVSVTEKENPAKPASPKRKRSPKKTADKKETKKTAASAAGETPSDLEDSEKSEQAAEVITPEAHN